MRVGTYGTRQAITLADSACVTAVVTMPQIILQMTNLSVLVIRMQSVEIDDGLHICQCNIGSWLLLLGTIIASVHFLVALLLNVKSEGIPDICSQNSLKLRPVSGFLFVSSQLQYQQL